MTSSFNTANDNYQNTQPQSFTEYPEVYFTHGNASIMSTSQNNQIPHERKSLLSSLGISKDMIGQFLPLLFGKSGGNNNNILSNLLGNNKNLSEIFSTLSLANNSKNTQDNKKDMPDIIDMSDFKEIKN